MTEFLTLMALTVGTLLLFEWLMTDKKEDKEDDDGNHCIDEHALKTDAALYLVISGGLVALLGWVLWLFIGVLI